MAQTARQNGTRNGSRFFPVSPYLILPRARGEFEIHLKQGDKLVLYSVRGERFTEDHRTRLADMGVEQLWIKALDKSGYESYVAQHLGDILDDDAIPIADRSKTWADVSTQMLEDMLGRDLPDAVFRSKFSKLKSVIRTTAHFFTDPAALKELSYYIGNGFSSYRHGLTVMVYTAALLGTFDDLDSSLVADVSVGSMLHDIGKSRMPQRLMEKEPRLYDETDRAALRSHPALGVSVCSRLPMPQEALNCILFHHERCDGTGYPSGAKKDELPFYARAVSLANCYDGLTRKDEFQQGVTPFEALSAIKDEGNAFDADLLKRFILILSNADIL